MSGRRNYRSDGRDGSHRHHTPPRNRRECTRGLHGISNEREIVHRPRVERGRFGSWFAMKWCDRGHEPNLGSGLLSVKYFAAQSELH